MKPTEILANEHRVIEQVLDCLERISERAEVEGRLDGHSAQQAIDFLRTFADRCHHAKEENQLFPALEARGFSRDAGPTAVMRHEHDLGRAHVRAMSQVLEAAAAGDGAALRQFAASAQGFVGLLREHIQKEDSILYPMANRMLGEADQQGLLAAFEHVEAEDMGAGTHQTYLRIADELADRFGVAHAETAAARHPGCGCGH